MLRRLTLTLITWSVLALGAGARAHAQDATDAPAASPARAHGPEAPDGQFPSHVFRWRARAPERVQLGFTYGLSQPLLAHGFNAAVDVRYRRLVATYSHGQGLDYTFNESAGEKAAGATVGLPVTTGGGVGLVLVDELWLLADVKVHRFDVATAVDHQSYTNVTVGAELGWRYFVWKGFNVGFVARYWPNVYSTAGSGITLHDRSGKAFIDPPAQQGYHGLLANVLIGWAFDL
jgi:hypothetical protein